MNERIEWSHPSVLAMLEEAGASDPYDEIERRARRLAVHGLEAGWSGPPYDPFELAELGGVETVPREDLDDARLVSLGDQPARIEFNPNRRATRVRFSVAHELGHLLFSDHGERLRYRNESHGQRQRADDWQLEVLCNVAAAEFLMPVGSFPAGQSSDLSLPHLLDLRMVFGVSTEALLRRAVKLTSEPACLFAAARLTDGRYRLDYLVNSQLWGPTLRQGNVLPPGTILSQCTAVGFSAEGAESWVGSAEMRVQAVGIPPYPGDRFPRLVGLLQPADAYAASGGPSLRYLRGDATEPRREGPTIVAHIVNDSARRWGGRGFAPALGRRYPGARDAYSDWASDKRHLRLGEVHLAPVGKDLWIASLVAQAGYGDKSGSTPRLRLSALSNCLETLASLAFERGASVEMPPIGTGQAGMQWATVRDLILEELVDHGVAVTVHVLPDEAMPDDEAPTIGQLALV